MQNNFYFIYLFKKKQLLRNQDNFGTLQYVVLCIREF